MSQTGFICLIGGGFTFKLIDGYNSVLDLGFAKNLHMFPSRRVNNTRLTNSNYRLVIIEFGECNDIPRDTTRLRRAAVIEDLKNLRANGIEWSQELSITRP